MRPLSILLRSPMVCTIAFIVFLIWFSIKEERKYFKEYSENGIHSSTMVTNEDVVVPRQPGIEGFLRERGKRRTSSHQESFNDYGEEDYGEGLSANPFNKELVRKPIEQIDNGIEDSDPEDPTGKSIVAIENRERLKMYLERDDSVIDPAFKNTKRIVVDANFHFFRDRYGLINPTFSVDELEDILRDVSRTWMRGNIWIRFKRLPRAGGKLISDKAADALRWWVFGFKDLKADRARYWRDVKLFLCEGASRMTKEEAEREVLKRYYEYGGHSLMNWILGLGGNSQRTTINIDVITVGFWPWYNGGAVRGRVFVRGGSCARDVYKQANISRDDTTHPICNGWKIDHEAGTDMSAAEMGRILSHEFGHIFGLAHPAKGACQYAETKDQLVLMAQQRSVAIKGSECSLTNPDAKHSRYVRSNEMTRARTVAQWISQQQRKQVAAAAESATEIEPIVTN